jgi:heme exporter protein A
VTVLSAHNVSCEKQDRILFEHLSLTLEEGELLLLRGENGAGKTSLLRILVGLSSPQTGSVTIGEFDAHSQTNQASEKLIYFGHKLGVSALLNPVENLRYWCKQHNVAATDADIIAVLDTLGLEGLEYLSVKHLSAGQQRRVSLARLWLSKDATLWVLDEPMTALDVNMVSHFEAHIAAFLKSGGSVIMTSHQRVSIDHPSREFELEYRW